MVGVKKECVSGSLELRYAKVKNENSKEWRVFGIGAKGSMNDLTRKSG